MQREPYRKDQGQIFSQEGREQVLLIMYLLHGLNTLKMLHRQQTTLTDWLILYLHVDIGPLN